MKNKKLYVILGYINSVGGWQLYIAHKLEYLKKTGWDTSVLAYQINKNEKIDIKIDALKPYKDNILCDFQKSLKGAFKRDVKKTVNLFLSKIGVDFDDYDEIIIESTSIAFAQWGEEIAKRIGARHFIYSVYAHYNYSFVPSLRPYLYYKYRRGEVATVRKNGLTEMFGDYAVISDSEKFFLLPGCIADIIEDEIDYKKKYELENCDYIIAMFGWLDKFYTENTLKEICIFAENNPAKKIGLVVIGGTSFEKKIIRFRNILSNASNIVYNFLGTVIPVPKNLFKIFDVCIASSGCARISYNLGTKTILMKDEEDLPYGILGHTVFYPNIYDKRCTDKQVSELLTDILINNEYNEMAEGYKTTITHDEVFKQHIDLIHCANPVMEYYDFGTYPLWKKIIFNIKPIMKCYVWIKKLLGKYLSSIRGAR